MGYRIAVARKVALEAREGDAMNLPTQGGGTAPVQMWRKVLAGWLRRWADHLAGDDEVSP